jgi:hypothetical protein
MPSELLGFGSLERSVLDRVGAFTPSPDDGNSSSFRNVVFSSSVTYRTMDRAQNPSNSMCHTPSPEPLRIY